MVSIAEYLQIQIPTDRTSGTRTRATQMLTDTIVEICSTPLTTAPRRIHLLTNVVAIMVSFPPQRTRRRPTSSHVASLQYPSPLAHEHTRTHPAHEHKCKHTQERTQKQLLEMTG